MNPYNDRSINFNGGVKRARRKPSPGGIRKRGRSVANKSLGNGPRHKMSDGSYMPGKTHGGRTNNSRRKCKVNGAQCGGPSECCSSNCRQGVCWDSKQQSPNQTRSGGRGSDHTHSNHYHSAYVPNTGQGYMGTTGPASGGGDFPSSGGHSHNGGSGGGARRLPHQPRSGQGGYDNNTVMRKRSHKRRRKIRKPIKGLPPF